MRWLAFLVSQCGKETVNIREKIRQVRLDRALDKINRQCAVLDETFWSDMAVQIRGHLAYVADSEAQTRRLGIVKPNIAVSGGGGADVH
jgi:hypothetical protein